MLAVLGANGLLGLGVLEAWSGPVTPVSRDDVDFMDFDRLEKFLDGKKLTALLNCAGIVDLNKVEASFKETAVINTELPAFLATYCLNRRIKFIQISTDHFYSDTKNLKSESSPVVLFNNYAKQKFAAEVLVLARNPNALVIRTNITGYRNASSPTFIEWMLSELKNSSTIRGFEDSIVSIISVELLVRLLEHAVKAELKGLYNIGSAGSISKFELIQRVAERVGSKCTVIPASIAELSVARARNCGLDCSKFESDAGVKVPSLIDVLNSLNLEAEYEKV